MMADVRELILVRLTEIIGAVPGIETTGRNLVEQSEVKTPLIVLYDGDEEAMETAKAGPVGQVRVMLPSVVLSLGDVAESAGSVTNEWRAKIIKPILYDTEIKNLCSGIINGGVKFAACTTSLNQGRTMQVELVINLEVRYSFIPAHL